MTIPETPFLQFWRLVSEATIARGLPRIPGPDIKAGWTNDLSICELVDAWAMQIAHEVA